MTFLVANEQLYPAFIKAILVVPDMKITPTRLKR